MNWGSENSCHLSQLMGFDFKGPVPRPMNRVDLINWFSRSLLQVKWSGCGHLVKQFRNIWRLLSLRCDWSRFPSAEICARTYNNVGHLPFPFTCLLLLPVFFFITIFFLPHRYLLWTRPVNWPRRVALPFPVTPLPSLPYVDSLA